MVAGNKRTDIFARLGLVKAPASLTCLGKVRVGKKFRGVKVGTGTNTKRGERSSAWRAADALRLPRRHPVDHTSLNISVPSKTLIHIGHSPHFKK